MSGIVEVLDHGDSTQKLIVVQESDSVPSLLQVDASEGFLFYFVSNKVSISS